MNKKQRVVISLLVVWTFANIVLYLFSHIELSNVHKITYTHIPQDEWVYYIQSGGARTADHTIAHIHNTLEYFYPLGDSSFTDYDFTEFLIYVGGAWLTYFIYRFITNG